MQQKTIKQIQLSAVLFLALIFGIIIINWFAKQSYIEVTLPTGAKSSVSIVNSTSGEEIFVEQNGGTVKQKVTKGEYTVLVRQADKSSLDAVKTKPFLRKTNIQPRLFSENSRMFVGNDPGPCVFYDGSILYSYGCGADFSDLKVHQPASPVSPTSTSSPPLGSSPSSTIGGVFRVGEKNYILVSGYFNIDDHLPRSIIYQVNPDATFSYAAELKDLPKSDHYNVKPYRGGFVVYDENYENITYYPSIGSGASRLPFDKPKDKGLKRSDVLISGDRVAVVYTEDGVESRKDSDSVNKLSGKTVVQILDGQSQHSYEYDGVYSKVSLCGEESLCLVGAKNLTIEDVSQKKSKNQMHIYGVNSIVPTEKGVEALRDSDILNIDTKTNHGFISYSSDDYRFCGVNTAANGYIVCLINNKNDRSAMFVSNDGSSSDDIDKKVLALSKDPIIQNVSAYKNILFITPELGDRVYNPTINQYVYEAQKKQEANKQINQLLIKYGIDLSKYQVVNTQN